MPPLKYHSHSQSIASKAPLCRLDKNFFLLGSLFSFFKSIYMYFYTHQNVYIFFLWAAAALLLCLRLDSFNKQIEYICVFLYFCSFFSFTYFFFISSFVVCAPIFHHTLWMLVRFLWWLFSSLNLFLRKRSFFIHISKRRTWFFSLCLYESVAMIISMREMWNGKMI